MNLLVLGAGAWGTALAVQASRRHSVSLWARDPQHVQDMLSSRLNQRYLAGHPLPPLLTPTHAPLSGLIQQAELVVLAVPMAA